MDRYFILLVNNSSVGDFVVAGPTFGWLNRYHTVSSTLPSDWYNFPRINPNSKYRSQPIVYNGAPLKSDYEEDYCNECSSSSESSSSDSEDDEDAPQPPSNVQTTVPQQSVYKDAPLTQQPYYTPQTAPYPNYANAQPQQYTVPQPVYYQQPYPQQPPQPQVVYQQPYPQQPMYYPPQPMYQHPPPK